MVALAAGRWGFSRGLAAVITYISGPLSRLPLVKVYSRRNGAGSIGYRRYVPVLRGLELFYVSRVRGP